MKKLSTFFIIATVALTSVFTSGDGSGKVEIKTPSTFYVMPVDFSQVFVM